MGVHPQVSLSPWDLDMQASDNLKSNPEPIAIKRYCCLTVIMSHLNTPHCRSSGSFSKYGILSDVLGTIDFIQDDSSRPMFQTCAEERGKVVLQMVGYFQPYGISVSRGVRVLNPHFQTQGTVCRTSFYLRSTAWLRMWMHCATVNLHRGSEGEPDSLKEG